MQKAYITALCALAQKDSNVLSLLADSGTGYDELFRRYFPDQLLDFGIAEENMAAAASGLASCGKIPFVYTAGAFLAYRSYEFIRDDICFQNQNVKVVGMGTGLAWSTLGPTHHTTEDLGVLRSLPNLTVFSPSCPRETEKCVYAAYEIKGPVYIRIGMNGEADIYGEDYEFTTGKMYRIREGKDLCIFTTGAAASEVVRAARLLEEQGIEAAVINVPTIKPFDHSEVQRAASAYPMLFTAEEHNVTGGLGSAVAEVLSELSTHAPLHRIGLPDRFALGYGTQKQVQEANGLDGVSVAEQIRACIQ